MNRSESSMAQKRRSRVNMTDVARESGVSLSTVSMVFSGKPGLPAETRQRVFNAARNLGYNPRRSSSSKHKGVLRTVGLVIKSQLNETPRSDQFYSQVVAGIELACRQNHLNLLYATMSTNLDNYAIEIPGLIQNSTADGLLLVGAMVDKDLKKTLRQHGRAVVLVDAYADDGEFDSVLSDNERGAYLATRHVIENGHRKIAFIGGSENAFPSFRERRTGYLKALQDHQIHKAFFADCYSRREDASNATLKLLSEHPEITALVGANDFIAISAMHVANRIGRKVGEDLSIVGFDDIILSESVIPPLTTMQVDKVAMGKMAVQLLVNRVEEPGAGHFTVVVHPRLVVRNSVKQISHELLSNETARADISANQT